MAVTDTSIPTRIRHFLGWRPEWCFLLIGVIFGLIFLIVLPLFQSPDERLHFFRAYQLSTFDLKSDLVKNNQGVGGYLPTAIVAATFAIQGDIAGQPAHKFHSSQLQPYLHTHITSATTAVQFEGAALYAPIPYLPQIGAIWIGRVLDLPVVELMYLVRLANLAVWLAVTWFAIRLIPVGKWALATLALLPISLIQAASMSADAFTNALVFLTIAAFLYYARRLQPLSALDMGGILLLTGALSLCKAGMVPLALVFVLLPARAYATVATRALFLMLLVGLNLGVTFGWTHYVQDIVPYVAAVDRPGVPIDYQAQFSGVVHHPLTFAATLLHTYFGSRSSMLYREFIGVFGWLDTPLPWWSVILGYVVLVTVFVADRVTTTTRGITRVQAWGFAVIAAALLGGASLLLYLTSTPIGQPYIDGVQGRYFLPVVAAIIPIVASRSSRIKPRNVAPGFIAAMASGMAVLLITSVVTLLNRYYG